MSCNVMIICDAAHITINVEAKWPGSVHDSRIFRESILSTRFDRGVLFFIIINVSFSPIATQIFDLKPCVIGQFDGYLLGDRGYPCQPYLMTPYPDPGAGPEQHFNSAHCRTRTRVEMIIGMELYRNRPVPVPSLFQGQPRKGR